VDVRSATLSNSDLRVGSEEVVNVNSDHSKLCRFGEASRPTSFIEYVDDLKSMIDGISTYGEQDLSWVEQHVIVDLHLFYDAKIWSFYPNLQGLVRKGPREYVRRKLRALEEAAIDEANVPVDGEEQQSAPVIVISPPDVDAPAAPSPILGELPDIVSKEKGMRSIEIEVPGNQERRGTTTSTPAQPTLHLPASDQARSDHDLHKQTAYKLPDQKLFRFRWMHVPANNMIWVPQLFQAVAEERMKPFLYRNLLHDQIWSLKQNAARHGSPHGRFMRPHCELLPPENQQHSSEDRILTCPTNEYQMALFVSCFQVTIPAILMASPAAIPSLGFFWKPDDEGLADQQKTAPAAPLSC
jgi:hypothetical protein